MAVGSGKALYIRIDQELRVHVSSDSLSCSIFKVANHLRKINEMAYEPQVISIGPYHRGKDHLKAMEVHKKHYLQMLLNRRKECTVEKYVKAMQGLKEKALKFYSEPPDQKDGGDQFVEMMLFDGSFVVELIRKSAMKELREQSDHLLTHFILRTVMRDLLLIENQLPFFILVELFDMTKMPNEADQNFMHMAINCFSIMMPGPCIKKTENHPGVSHLLGLLHDSCVSPDYEGSSEEERILAPRHRRLGGHLLGFLHDSCVSPDYEGSSEEERISASVSLIRGSAPLVTFPPPPEPPTQSALHVTLPPIKPPMAEVNTVPMIPHHSEIEAEPVLPSDEDYHDFSVATDAPLVSVPSSKMPEGVNSLPSDAILVNIHHSEMDTDSGSFVPAESPIGSFEDNPRALYSESMKLEEAISRTSKGPEEKNCNWQTIRSASEVHEAGIEFQKIENSKLFDIKFEEGVMSIPTLKVYDDTESILRNLVAYEQCYEDIYIFKTLHGLHSIHGLPHQYSEGC